MVHRDVTRHKHASLNYLLIINVHVVSPNASRSNLDNCLAAAERSIRDREYLGAVVSMTMNAEYASVLYDGKVQLHMV